MSKYSYRQQMPSTRWRWIVTAFVLLGLIMAVVAWCVYDRSPSVSQSKNSVSKQQSLANGMTSKILVVGDIFWGRAMQRYAERSGLGPSYITSGLSPELRGQYDAWIGNGECPVTSKDIDYNTQISSLQFNCRPEYLPTLAQYFTAVSLANNHMDNNGGKWGLEQTRQELTKANIQFSGSYDRSDIASTCEVIAIPAQTENKQKTSAPVALCGYHQVVNIAPTDEQLAVMAQYAKVMPVIAMPHMGVEYRTAAEAEKVSAYRKMIDAGADVVVGAHPHVVQNSEIYKGKLIAYSVGNFLFDQQSVSNDTNFGLGVQLTLKIPAGTAATQYQKLGEACKVYKDDCLQRLQKSAVQRPAITVSYGAECFDLRTKATKIAQSGVCQPMLDRAGVSTWSQLNRSW